MDLFSISQLSSFSGIKPHTIRIWEQRYAGLQPTRSEGNTRYYNNQQLRRLLNIVSLKDEGFKVSDLCSMPDKKLSELVAAQHPGTATGETKPSFFIAQMIAAGMAFDEKEFDSVYDKGVRKYGITGFYKTVLYPLLVRIGLLWASDQIIPGYEHFISNCLRKKMILAYDMLPAGNEMESWILFLPEDEYHELGLLFAAYLLRAANKKVYYIGTSTPISTVEYVLKQTKANNLLCFFVAGKKGTAIREFALTAAKQFSNKKIFIACDPEHVTKMRQPGNLSFLHGVNDLENLLNTSKRK